MSFLLEYLKNPARTGAVAPSSKKLAKRMMETIDFDSCSCIVEYGPGTGAFTDEIIKRKSRDTVFLVIEQNVDFYNQIRKKYTAVPNLLLVNGDAGDLERYLAQYHIEKVEYIVSGLPFASLPKKVSDRIMETTGKVMGEKGSFITFQYTLLKKKFFERSFQIKKITFELFNFPPAFVIVMKKK